MDMQGTIVGLLLVSAVVMGVFVYFTPMLSDSTYGQSLDQAPFAPFNRTFSSINNLANSTYDKIARLQPDQNTGPLTGVTAFISAADLFINGIFIGPIKLMIETIPNIILDLANISTSQFPIPFWLISVFIDILIIGIVFWVISLFFWRAVK